MWSPERILFCARTCSHIHKYVMPNAYLQNKSMWFVSPSSFSDCPSCPTGAVAITDGHSRNVKILWDHYEDSRSQDTVTLDLRWMHVCSLTRTFALWRPRAKAGPGPQRGAGHRQPGVGFIACSWNNGRRIRGFWILTSSLISSHSRANHRARLTSHVCLWTVVQPPTIHAWFLAGGRVMRRSASAWSVV